MNTNMKRVQELLKKKGLKASAARVMMLEDLYSRYDHPTADMIYESLKVTLPSLSRTTVYNCLNAFVKKGLALEVLNSGGEARFDGDLKYHAHFSCKKCGKMSDIDGVKSPKLAIPKGHNVHNVQINVTGYCPTCK
jgi:Fur family transcriptional regulator, peroxide stress response regulator